MLPLGLPKLSADPVLFLPLWLGTLRDASVKGNHGAAGGNTYWSAVAGRDSVDFLKDGEIIVADSPELQGLAWTVFLAGHHWDRFLAANHIFTKADGGGTQYQIRQLSATQWLITDGANFPTRNYAVTLETRSMCFTFGDGLTAELFIDGVTAGAFSGVNAITANDAPLAIGNQVAGFAPNGARLSAVVACPGILPPDEILLLHEYLDSRITPRKQWPGSGLRYPDRHTEQLTNGDFTSWIPGTYPNPTDWGTVSPDTPENHITEDPAGHLRMVSNSLEFVGISQVALTVGQLYKCTLVVSAAVSGLGIVSGAGPNYFIFSTVATHVFFFVADSSALILKRGTACDITVDSISVIEQPADYVPRTGDLMYRANIQSAWVSLATETSGQLSNTGLRIVTGSWAVTESAAGRAITCVGSGRLQPSSNIVGADGWDTALFEQTGGVVLTKNAANFTLDATNGDTVTALELTAP